MTICLFRGEQLNHWLTAGIETCSGCLFAIWTITVIMNVISAQLKKIGKSNYSARKATIYSGCYLRLKITLTWSISTRRIALKHQSEFPWSQWFPLLGLTKRRDVQATGDGETWYSLQAFTSWRFTKECGHPFLQDHCRMMLQPSQICPSGMGRNLTMQICQNPKNRLPSDEFMKKR